MSLADDLQATADRLRDGWTITSLARAKRAQENTMARTTHEIILPPPGACHGDGLAQHALMERAHRAEIVSRVEELILRHTGRVEPDLADNVVDAVLADAVLVQR